MEQKESERNRVGEYWAQLHETLLLHVDSCGNNEGSGKRDAAADKQLTTVGDCIKTCPWSSNWSLVTPHLA